MDDRHEEVMDDVAMGLPPAEALLPEEPRPQDVRVGSSHRFASLAARGCERHVDEATRRRRERRERAIRVSGKT